MNWILQSVNRVGHIVSNFYWDIGVDLGTSNTLVWLRDRGVVIDEPTMISRLRKKKFSGLSAPKSRASVNIAFGEKGQGDAQPGTEAN